MRHFELEFGKSYKVLNGEIITLGKTWEGSSFLAALNSEGKLINCYGGHMLYEPDNYELGHLMDDEDIPHPYDIIGPA